MSRHLEREIDNLKRSILALGAKVEETVFRAVESIITRDARRADEIIAADDRIDQTEVEIEEDCLKILALHQPVAIDLRFIIAVLKINNDLERIADLASNIASRARGLAELPQVTPPYDMGAFSGLVKGMLKKSLDALVNLDCKQAWEVCQSDDQVDDIHRNTYKTVAGIMRSQPEKIEACMMLVSVSRNLERIADHATNIAEDVIYMVEGRIVRHRSP
jgi:phosphate transport system protein